MKRITLTVTNQNKGTENKEQKKYDSLILCVLVELKTEVYFMFQT